MQLQNCDLQVATANHILIILVNVLNGNRYFSLCKIIQHNIFIYAVIVWLMGSYDGTDTQNIW